MKTIKSTHRKFCKSGFLVFCAFTIFAGSGCKESDSDLQNLIQKAEAGQADIQYGLCNVYANGQGVERNIQEGLKWCERAAAQNHVQALNNLGDIYREGKIVPADLSKANEYYLKSAELEDAYGQLQIGYSYHVGSGLEKNINKALGWLQKSANQNNDLAQRYLGKVYADGDGVPANYDLAFKWFSKAAEAGNADAQNDLGLLYQDGQGVPQNYLKAKEWFQKSANQNNFHAHYNLGYLYYQGPGELKSDYFKAGEEFLVAAEGGIAEAKKILNDFGRECSAKKTKDIIRQENYCIVSAGAGISAEAEFKVAKLYLTVKNPNIEEGVYWLRKAAAKNYPEAILYLAVGYFNGDWVEKNDLIEAYAWAELLQQDQFEKKYKSAGEKLQKTLRQKMTEEQLKEARKKIEKYKISFKN